MIIGITNAKGGSGKSTLAVHLAGALDERGRTALVDLDEHGTCVEHASGGHLPHTTTDAHGWDAGLNREAWAHVVVDGFARPSKAQLAALAEHADLLLLPTPPDAASLKVLAKHLPAVQATSTPFAVVAVMVPSWPCREGDRALRDLRADPLHHRAACRGFRPSCTPAPSGVVVAGHFAGGLERRSRPGVRDQASEQVLASELGAEGRAPPAERIASTWCWYSRSSSPGPLGSLSFPRRKTRPLVS